MRHRLRVGDGVEQVEDPAGGPGRPLGFLEAPGEALDRLADDDDEPEAQEDAADADPAGGEQGRPGGEDEDREERGEDAGAGHGRLRAAEGGATP